MLAHIEFQHKHLTISDTRQLFHKTLLAKKMILWSTEELQNNKKFNKKFHKIWDREGLTFFDENRSKIVEI